MARSHGTSIEGQVRHTPRIVASVQTVWHDVNLYNATAGLTSILLYITAATPIFLAVVASLALSPSVATSWFLITFLTSGVSTMLLSLRYRRPLTIGWTIPGLVFLGTAADGVNLEELAGVNLVAGIVILVLGLLGVGERLMRWLPLPLVLGMFAGTILQYVTRIFEQLGTHPVIVGAALAGYIVARARNRPWLPPVGGAVASGLRWLWLSERST